FGVSDLPPRRRPFKLRLHTAFRWLHIYISMISMLIIFFFAITGVTLNHPEWIPAESETIIDESGSLPADWNAGGEVNWLTIVEHLRAEHGIRGNLFDYRVDDFEGFVAFKSPGYAADAFFDPSTGEYQVTIVSQGFLGVLNQLHRGTEAQGPWRVAIDVAGALLAVLSLTGIGLLLYLRKFRVSALIT